MSAAMNAESMALVLTLNGGSSSIQVVTELMKKTS
jgi:hypothetical protein